MKLKTKITLPHLFYVVLMALVGWHFFHFTRTAALLNQEQRLLGEADAAVQGLMRSSEAFLDQTLGYDAMAAALDQAAERLRAAGQTIDLAPVRAQFDHLQQVMARNDAIDGEITTLTQSSIKNSNDYIQQACARLSDARTSASVSVLERMVIVGANVNTSSNYEIQVRFAKLRERLDAQAGLLELLERLMKNVEQDVQNLAGTPFAQLPVQARAANLKVKALALEYIRNAGELGKAKGQVRDGLARMMASFDESTAQGSSRLFARIREIFLSLLIALTLVAGAGVTVGLWVSGSLGWALERIIGQLDGAAAEASAAALQVAQSGEEVAAGTGEQASGVEQITASLEETAAVTRQNAETARTAQGVVSSASQSAGASGESMSQLTQALGEIKAASGQTAQIIKTINEIAFQTNLLALNAAVEAARAGEAGKGFAVVAEEVRALAQRAAQAVQSTGELIEGMQQRAERGVKMGGEVAGRLERIKTEITQVDGLVAEVAAASQEQAKGIEQINTAMTAMDRVIQSNAASAEESAAAGQRLSEQAGELKQVIQALVQVMTGGER